MKKLASDVWDDLTEAQRHALRSIGISNGQQAKVVATALEGFFRAEDAVEPGQSAGEIVETSDDLDEEADPGEVLQEQELALGEGPADQPAEGERHDDAPD